MMGLISIIVPVYNVEKYLERCVNSLRNQTYKEIEIILVDDGSPDRCPQICDELKKKDERIRVLHKENGGLSSARNEGIRVANGKYIAFVDSDDYIANDMFEKLYRAIEKDGSDMCICDFCSVDEEGNPVETDDEQYPFENAVLSREEILKLVCGGTGIQNDWRFIPAWNKLYSKKIFETCSFAEGKLHEDEFAIHHFVYECERISIIPDKLYYYVQRENSIMNSQFSIKRFDAALAYKDRYEFTSKIDKQIGKFALAQIYVYLVCNLHKFDVKNNNEVIRPMVIYVIKELIKNGNLRFAKLALAYLKTII